MLFGRLVTRGLLASSLLLAGACAGRVPEGGPERTYYLEVENPMPYAMNVSLDIGKGLQALGSVDANQTRRFTINNPGTDEVKLIAADQGNTHQVQKSIDLDKDQTVRVTLKQ
jgi:hypothetical protein